MTTEEQFQSSDIQQINGTEDDHTSEQDDETTSNTSSPAPQVRRSRFFRSKRKQRLHEEQSHQVDSNNEVFDELENSSESQEKPPAEETSVEKLSTNNTETAMTPTVPKRSLSPPPPPPSSDDTDEPDASSISEQSQLSSRDNDAELQFHSANRSKPQENTSFAQSRSSVPSVPSLHSGYQRKKSQSVKLTRIDPIDSYPKKNVRFADDFGLDLSQIKVIKSDELPHVPSAAFKDLHVSNDDNPTSFYQERMRTISYLEQQFDNPIHAHGFEDRVLRHKVVLEQASKSVEQHAIDNRIYGTIKIISYGLNKRVQIRLTTDNWITHKDHDATYIMDSFDGTHDRFTFTLDIDRDRLCVGNNIQFCIRYESYIGPEYWDSNYQQNYRFDCVSRTIPDYSA